MRRLPAAVAVLAFGCALAAAAPARAGDIHVNTTSMANDGTDGVCSFHEALASAFSQTNSNECTGAGAAPNRILFDQDGTYTAIAQLPDVINELTVDACLVPPDPPGPCHVV